MYSYKTTVETIHWLILPNVKDAGETLVPLANVSHVTPADGHGGALVYLKSHGYAIETTMSVDDIIETLRRLSDDH